jgi:hypothetical protein
MVIIISLEKKVLGLIIYRTTEKGMLSLLNSEKLVIGDSEFEIKIF